jgi:hypothetical protein
MVSQKLVAESIGFAGLKILEKQILRFAQNDSVEKI